MIDNLYFLFKIFFKFWKYRVRHWTLIDQSNAMYGVSGFWALPGNKEMKIINKHHVRNGIGDPFIFIQIKASIVVYSNWKIYQNPNKMSKALKPFLPTSFPVWCTIRSFSKLTTWSKNPTSQPRRLLEHFSILCTHVSGCFRLVFG